MPPDRAWAVRLHGAPAARRDRRHCAVQRAVSSGDGEGGAGARRGEWLHPETLEAGPGDQAQDRRGVRRSGPADGPPQRRPRSCVGGRRRHLRRPASADDHLRRLHPERGPSCGRGGEDAEALHARNGGKEPAHRSRRCRRRLRRARGRVRHLLPSGPGLHGELPHPGRGADLRRLLRTLRRRGEESQGRRSA